MLYTFPQFIFGFFSYFSGLSLFDEYYLLLYNLAFTSFTVSLLGCTDRDISYFRVKNDKEMRKEKKSKQLEYVKQHTPAKADSESSKTLPSDEKVVDESKINCAAISIIQEVKDKFQHFYYISQKSLFFTPTTFLGEIVSSMIQSTMITLITTYIFKGSTVLSKSGYTSDHWCVSFTVYTSIVFASNLALCFRSREIHWISVFFMSMTSIVPFFAFMLIYDRFVSLNLESDYSAFTLLRSFHYYLTVTINMTLVALFEIASLLKSYGIKPTLVDYVRVLIKSGDIGNKESLNEKIIKKIKGFHALIKKYENVEDFDINSSEIESKGEGLQIQREPIMKINGKEFEDEEDLEELHYFDEK